MQSIIVEMTKVRKSCEISMQPKRSSKDVEIRITFVQVNA